LFDKKKSALSIKFWACPSLALTVVGRVRVRVVAVVAARHRIVDDDYVVRVKAQVVVGGGRVQVVVVHRDGRVEVVRARAVVAATAAATATVVVVVIVRGAVVVRPRVAARRIFRLDFVGTVADRGLIYKNELRN
jgi:hypothetical protein